jgi:hypothetical protein
VRQFAYGRSGEWLYGGLRKLKLPPAKALPDGESPFRLPVDWKEQSRENGRAFPFLGKWEIPYGDGEKGTKVLFTAFRTKFHSHGRTLFDGYFEKVKASHRFTEEHKKEIQKNAFTCRERSLVFHLAWEGDKVQVVYYPGRIQFKGGAREHMGKWLPRAHWRFRQGIRTDHALIQDSHGLLAILNGVFDKSDNFVTWNKRGKMRYGGFGYDFTILMEPQPEMATCATYEDGTLRIGAWRGLPDKRAIRTFVQNRFMVIEDGKPAKDADPDAFREFCDNIARGYLFTDRNGRVGYLWSLYTPANVLVPIALELGVKDMMLTDIHAPLSCILSDPAGPLAFKDWRDHFNRSFDFVPNFFRLSAWQASLTWLSEALQSRIQTHYPQEAFKLGREDYFALFLKGSPEALRVSRPRVSATASMATPGE